METPSNSRIRKSGAQPAPAIRYNLPDMITFLLALLALIIAVMNGTGKGGRIPLWVAVALLALGMMIPWLVSISVL